MGYPGGKVYLPGTTKRAVCILMECFLVDMYVSIMISDSARYERSELALSDFVLIKYLLRYTHSNKIWSLKITINCKILFVINLKNWILYLVD